MPLWRPSAKSEDRPQASSSQGRPWVRLEVKLTGLYPKINVKTFESYKIFKVSRRVFIVFLFLLKSNGSNVSNIYCDILKRCSNITSFCKFENLKVESRKLKHAKKVNNKEILSLECKLLN
mgnify:CR=1 FL=1